MQFAFFDLDETLHDKRATLQKVASYIYESFGIENYCSYIPFERIFIEQNEIIQPKDEVFKNITSRIGLPHDPQVLLNEFDRSFHHFCQKFDGVSESLELLQSKNFTIGCITNGRDFFQRNKIKGLGIEHFFSVIVTSGELKIKKPDHRIFQHALKEANATPSQSFYCGDSVKSDITPTKEMGFTTILKYRTDNNCQICDYSFNQYSLFPSIIEKLLSS